jgi:putative transposase
MEEQKKDIIAFVQGQKVKGQSITESLKALGVKRSTFYSWLSPREEKKTRLNIRKLAPYEQQAIEETKERHPHLRHRQIQGILQNKGIYLSMSSVYHHLKSLNQVKPYERRPSPLKEPKYSIWQRNLMWACDWTKLLINHIRWYLIILIDFFSRYIIGYNIHPSINASHVKHLYAMGLKNQGISPAGILPELRTDRGSPNTSWVTKEFFSLMGADISYARVHRPTDNAFTERFFGTVKQEEIHIVGSYPDEQSARSEIGTYIDSYNMERPHQSLWNFTPAFVHEVNNNTLLLEKLTQLKYEAKMKRRYYWEERTI